MLAVAFAILAASLLAMGAAARTIAPEHARMWKQKFTPEQWLELLRRREHQPAALWHGVRAGSVTRTGTSISFSGLTFRDSESNVLETQLGSGLLKEHSLLFLSLFDDDDPETVLTGIFPYRRLLPNTKLLDAGQVAAIAGAIRRKLLGHKDVRIRWAAVQTLGENRWLTAEDVRRGLDDETDAIRVTTAFWLVVMREPNGAVLYDQDGRLVQGTPEDVRNVIDTHRKLAPILLDHVNDTHFLVRANTASAFRALFRRWEKTEGGRRQIGVEELPEEVDWVRADWHTRTDAQAAWKQWWAEKGEAALVKAHPLPAAADE
jgi:hypothetical protein